MKQYLDLLQHILDNGIVKEDRTGTGTKSVFGYQMRFDLSNGFPLVTTKKTFLKGIISELLWFIEGSTDERRLAEIHYGDKRENIIGKNTHIIVSVDPTIALVTVFVPCSAHSSLVNKVSLIFSP